MTYYLSPIGTSCHFPYAADAPLLSLSRHFPRFSGGIYPEGGSHYRLCEEAKQRSKLPGGRVFAKYILLSLVMGYFAIAQYDVLFIPYRHFVPLPPKEEAKLHVILNEVKNPTEKVRQYILFTSVVGYFADAQYDAPFQPNTAWAP